MRGPLMRRGLRGATRRPPLERPGNGYGRHSRPGPAAGIRVADERIDLDEQIVRILDEGRAVREREGFETA
jgi:hypothetical protein